MNLKFIYKINKGLDLEDPDFLFPFLVFHMCPSIIYNATLFTNINK